MAYPTMPRQPISPWGRRRAADVSPLFSCQPRSPTPCRAPGNRGLTPPARGTTAPLPQGEGIFVQFLNRSCQEPGS